MQLACRNLSFKYPDTGQWVIRDLNFNIATPGFHALFGPSGTGKTSIGRILSGDLTHYSGQIVTQQAETILYSYNMERLPGWSTVEVHLNKITPQQCLQRKNDLVRLFGMETYMARSFNRLSLGQKNRVNLIRYLLQSFDVLILDESLANVDEPTREKIILNIKKLYPDRLFVYISHNVMEVSKFCDQIIVLRQAAKKPQSLVVQGQNCQLGQDCDKQVLSTVMLEIMNAA